MRRRPVIIGSGRVSDDLTADNAPDQSAHRRTPTVITWAVTRGVAEAVAAGTYGSEPDRRQAAAAAFAAAFQLLHGGMREFDWLAIDIDNQPVAALAVGENPDGTPDIDNAHHALALAAHTA